MHDGRLIPYRLVAKNVEELRRARIRIALDKKLGKLADCKSAGDRTVLILEDNDLPLSNPASIAGALSTEIGYNNRPDYIFIADTCLDNNWSLFQVFIKNRGSFDIKRVDAERGS